MAAGCLGLVLLLEPWALDWSDTRLVVGLGMLLTGAVMMAATTVHIRGHRWRATPFELMPWQLMLGAVPTVALAWCWRGHPSRSGAPWWWRSSSSRSLFASSFAMWGELKLCRSLPSISANLFLMAIPAIGLGASVLWAGGHDHSGGRR